MNATIIIIQLINYLITAFTILILVEVIASWIPAMGLRLPDWAFEILRIIHMLTSPILDPIRRLLPNMGGLDFSPLIALLLLQVLGSVIIRAISGF